jgi:hypothetical protein
MHDSVKRLMDCARRATEGLEPRKQVTDTASLQDRLAVSPQAFHNWTKRGVSKEGAIAAERAFGCAVNYILEGHGPHWTYPQTPPEGEASTLLAQELSHPTYTVTPGHIPWEQLMDRPLKPEFQTTAPDNAMAPDVPRGARIILITGVDPAPGDFVLVADATGAHYLREYKQLRAGHWQAHARNAAFLPLDSLRDGLRVLAVFDGIRGRRAGA